MQTTLLEANSTHLKLEFKLDINWMQAQKCLPKPFPPPLSQAESLFAPAMRQGLEVWLKEHPYTLWDNPSFKMKRQDIQGLCYVAQVPAVQTPDLPSLESLICEWPSPPAELDWMTRLAQLQLALADSQNIPGPAEWGMRLTVNALGLVNGIPIPDSLLNEAEWLLTPELLYPGFASQLLGLKVGQSKELSVILPSDYPIAAWAGRPAIYQVKILRIERLRLPFLDNNFAQKTGHGQSLNELESALKHQAELQMRLDWSQQVITSVLDQLSQALTLPDQLINAQMLTIWKTSLEPGLLQRRCNAQQLQKAQEYWLQHRSYRQSSIQQLRRGLLYKLLIEKFGLSLSAQEVETYLSPIAERLEIETDTVFELLETHQQLNGLVQDLLRQKAEQELLKRVSFMQNGQLIDWELS